MDAPPELQPQRRVKMIARFALLWAAVLLGRLIYLQVYRHDHYLRMAHRQQELDLEIQAARGTIFDRSGRQLAMSLPVDSICVNPQRIPDHSLAADILAGTLKVDRQKLLEDIQRVHRRGGGFLWVKRRISLEESERLHRYGLDWVEFRKESKRFYPKDTLAAHVLGQVNHEEKGSAGIERSLNSDLAGRPGRMRVLTDVRGRGFASEVWSEAEPGKDVTLSIDERIQYVADREIKRAVITNRAETGSLVVMDPRTGDLLAVANYPSFNPNHLVQPGESLESRTNLAISTPFEPGSVFKVITLAAALDATALSPESLIDCGGGVLNLFGRVIHEAKRGFGTLSVAEVLARSSNIGAIQIGRRLGDDRFKEYIRRFGFGRRTGVSLPGESPGMVRQRWDKTSIGSVAMGHEISTTTVQLALAVAVIANGGLLVKPRIVLKKQRPGGPAETIPVETPQRVIAPETSISMRKMMEGVVLETYGTGRRARLIGYTAGGKTGSAQIFDFNVRQYRHGYYNASFAGFAPLTNPSIVVVVTLNGAREYGGAVAAPVFREVAMGALRLLDVPKDLPDEPLPDERRVEDNDVAIAEIAAPPVSREELLASGPDAEGSEPEPPRVASGPRVPDFHGKSMRSVMEESAAIGLRVDLVGSGLARAQIPAPGSVLTPGERVRVHFAR